MLERDESEFRWQNVDYDDNLIQVILGKWNWFPGGTEALVQTSPICSERGEKIGYPEVEIQVDSWLME